jgi:hypothetical protein
VNEEQRADAAAERAAAPEQIITGRATDVVGVADLHHVERTVLGRAVQPLDVPVLDGEAETAGVDRAGKDAGEDEHVVGAGRDPEAQRGHDISPVGDAAAARSRQASR